MKDARPLDALAATLKRLEKAETSQDEDAIWAATREALNWLYECEEAEKTTVFGYYERRNGSEAGRTAGGLIWVRGLAVHHQAEVRRLLWQKTRTFFKVDGEMRPTRIYVMEDGQMTAVTPRVATARWPTVGFLPEATTPAHERDSMYEDHVAGRPLMTPLQTALGYFRGKA